MSVSPQGYARARRVIWAGTAAVLFMAWAVVTLPPAPDCKNQAAYEVVFGQVPRIVLASSAHSGRASSSCCGPARSASTVAVQGVDSLIFYPLAFWNAEGWTHELVIQVRFTQWVLKVSWEVLLTPFPYLVVHILKRCEGVDLFDEGTNFTPFATRV